MCYIGKYVRTVVVEPLEVPILAHVEPPEEAEQPAAIPVEQPDPVPVPVRQ